MKFIGCVMSVVLIAVGTTWADRTDRADTTNVAAIRWTLKRDHLADHDVKFPDLQRVELKWRQPVTGDAFATGGFQAATLSHGDTNNARFYGQIVGDKNKMPMLQQDEKRDGSRDGMMYTGREIAPNYFRGT